MTDIGGISSNHLRQFIERIERLEEDKSVVSEDIREVYAEAKANGFDAKIMRQVIKLRKMDSAERSEGEVLLNLYLSALGMAEPVGSEEELNS
ncbi:MAG: DUF2312 domain-containing protein [Alphaproteobacteria bacterium]|nr:DUF2312 domain-containing protein [Alphaproteobacteria bacterium]